MLRSLTEELRIVVTPERVGALRMVLGRPAGDVKALEPGTTKEERRVRHFALGAAGALGAGAAFVRVESGGHVLTLSNDEVMVVERPKLPGTRLHLHKAFGWRVMTGLLRGAPETKAVASRAHRLPLGLTLNGTQLTRRGAKGVVFQGTGDPKTAVRRPLAHRELSGDGWKLEVVLPLDAPLGRSTLELDVLGVLVADRTLQLPGVQLEAWLRADGLRRNASGSDVVDDDPVLLEVRRALTKLSRSLLLETLDDLCERAAWREHFVARLLEGEEDTDVKFMLQRARLLPGPAGEFSTLAEVTQEAREHGRLHFATQEWPKGSYPAYTVLLTQPGLEKLLPSSRRVNVANLVEQRARIVGNRARVEGGPVEQATLRDDAWDARVPVTGTGVTGELGLAASVAGAFVRVLHHGRPLEALELSSLAPLRLRAVVNLERPLNDSFFDEDGAKRLVGLLFKNLEDAAMRALTLTLKEGTTHALDALAWIAAQHGWSKGELPNGLQTGLRDALREAPLFPCVERPTASIAELIDEPTWQYVPSGSTGLLDGTRVLVLDGPRLAVLKRLAGKRLEDVSPRLLAEREIRQRLAGPAEAATLPDPVVRVSLQGEGFTGEVGLPKAATTGLTLTLLRAGVRLEVTKLSARYQHAEAIVDCAALRPNPRWTAVVRDDAFQRVLTAVQDAERRLIVPLVATPRAKWPEGGEAFFTSFLSKELRGLKLDALDDTMRQVAAAKLFDAGVRRVSLHDLAERGRFWSLPANSGRPNVPDDLLVLFEPPQVLAALGEALGFHAESALPELERREARRRLFSLPLAKVALPPGLALVVTHRTAHVNATAGLRDGVDAEARVLVVVDGREYARAALPCALPLEAVIELPGLEPSSDLSLTPGQLAEVQQVLGELVALTLRGEGPHVARASLLALGRNADAQLPTADAKALRTRRLFRCTNGETYSCDAIAIGAQRFVTSAQEGTLPEGPPIVIVDDVASKVALQRWPKAENVDALLAQQREARARRAAVAAVERISLKLDSPWRQQLSEEGVEGEVAVVREHAGRVELFLERKPLCVLEGVLEGPFAAAVDAKVTPTPTLDGVVKNPALSRVLELVKASCERLAQRLDATAAPAGWEATQVGLAFHLAEADAWRWRGNKKSKKKKAVASPSTHPLVRAPLLRANDATGLSVDTLIGQQLTRAQVAVVSRGGTFLDPVRRAWWPRAGEEELARRLSLVPQDVSAELHLADRVRARPKFDDLAAPIESAWREPVRGAGLEGEVALAAQPDKTLVVEVLQNRTLLERWSGPNAVGGIARVEASLVTPDERHTAAVRDGAFKALLKAVQEALERLVVRRLEARGDDFGAWARAAILWRFGDDTPLSALFPSLPLFRSLGGEPVTIGAVLQAAAKDRRVSVATRGTPPPDVLVLRDDLDTRAALDALDLRYEDVSAELQRAAELRDALTSRRLATLAWRGEALVRLAVATPPLRGELALSSAAGEVLLARDGIAVSAHEERWPGVVGVLDVEGLHVDADWKKATPTRAQVTLLRAQVDALYGALAEASHEYDDETRERAATWVLQLLGREVKSPVDVDRLKGVAKVLAAAPLFLTVEGERVSLRTVAAEISTRERVAVFEHGPGRVSSCVLKTTAFSAPWLSSLEDLFGKTRVWRVTDSAEWGRLVREEDPPDGTPLLDGLQALRKHVRLLRAGALGSLTPNELEGVRLSRDGGHTALRFDARRKLLLLDPQHPDIKRTLEELTTRPERLWVLIAACFGLINRELQHVTDADEAQLVTALAGHLASNPQLLSLRKRAKAGRGRVRGQASSE